jgi:non-canonical (house-cleaning) NTP pyrophosphatase
LTESATLRLFTPDCFSMTAGVAVPFDAELLEDVLDEVPQLARKRTKEAADDRRFAEAVYRIALESGLTKQIAFQDPVRKSL